MNQGKSWITRTPGVCGGEACVRHTRYTVWGLVEWKRLGLSDADLLEQHPELTPADLDAAWEYYDQHPQEIEQALWENEACMVEPGGRDVPPDLVRRGRRLGMSDERIRTAFQPPLTQAELEDILIRAAPATGTAPERKA
jgi:uncharacterized protein (DUF433 family)